MKEICVQLGCSSRDPEQHCFDGDSSYVTGSVENTLVRLLGIDAPEIREVEPRLHQAKNLVNIKI